MVAFAQSGDKAGEQQLPLVPTHLIPSAPALTPEEALKTFKVQPGFRMELVAAEPLVQDPVQIVFDPDGRIWVVEMTAYMPNVDGDGESAPVGKIAVLEDTNGDGRMDKRTVFLDGIVMPRALALVRGGVLVSEAPKLWYCRDTNGDGKCDSKELVADNYAKEADPRLGARCNPEHAANTLMPAMDNWIYSANFTTKYRYDGESWQKAPTAFRGQWGLSQDNFGRLYFNSNSDQFRVDLVPSEYLSRNPYLRGPMGLYWKPVADQAVYPIRVNPGVNRGYRKGQLREGEWTLATYTAASGPVVYRGDNFPADCVGNQFVPEPAGNLIRRNVTTEKDGFIAAKNAYDKAEFIASTDERFRPVNLNNGPDGALYIVDFYRGIIQHRVFLTSYLRDQIKSRGLDQPIHMGRIWRVVADGKPAKAAPKLGNAKPEELVAALSHANGWVRDTAQQLLVERAPAAAVPALKELAVSGKEPLGRLHALWTLDGLGQMDLATATKVLSAEKHPKVLAAAIRVSEPLLKGEAQAQLLPKLTALADHKQADVRLQLAFTLGNVVAADAEAAMVKIALASGTNALIRDALISGLMGREDEMIARLIAIPGLEKKHTGVESLLSGLAKCVAVRAKGEEVKQLLAKIAAPGTPVWQTAAVLNGLSANAPVFVKGKPKSGGRIKYLRVDAEPEALAVLRKSGDKSVKASLAKLDSVLVWPGKVGAPPAPVIKPLNAEQQARLEMGKVLYEATCGACHQPHGFGQEGLAPPLADSEWVAMKPSVLSRIVLHGVRGPISVQGRKWDLDMPSFNSLDDEQLAAVLTYIRREWDHTYDPIDPADVKKTRTTTADRAEAWTETELKSVK